MQKIAISLIALITFVLTGVQVPASLFADTVIAKDGREVKGIIVEEYNDRIVISTPDGEATILKGDIAELSYDNEEDNLIRLGEQARLNGNYNKSFTYYTMASKLNPGSRRAKEGLVLLQGYLYRKDEAKKIAMLNIQQDYESGIKPNEVTVKEEEKTAGQLEKIRKATGMGIAMIGNFPGVSSVQTNSPAYETGIRKGDLIVAIWGKLTGYLSIKEVADILERKMSLEIRCTIERTVDVRMNDGSRLFAGTDKMIGAGLSMELEGLTVSKVLDGGPALEAGLKKGDRITFVDGEPTRYMPIKQVIEHIRRTKNNIVKLTIRRDVVVWWSGSI